MYLSGWMKREAEVAPITLAPSTTMPCRAALKVTSP
jgi:hypothetical protein